MTAEQTFRSWLFMQAELDSRLGDLARDVKRDGLWQGHTFPNSRLVLRPAI